MGLIVSTHLPVGQASTTPYKRSHLILKHLSALSATLIVRNASVLQTHIVQHAKHAKEQQSASLSTFNFSNV